MHNIDLSELTRAETRALQDDLKKRMGEFRPYRIGERMTACASDKCDCRTGGGLHGPYLAVTYRTGGVTKKVSLGPKYDHWELKENVPDRPRIEDYLTVSDNVYQEMTVSAAKGYVSHELSEYEFSERHGVSKASDDFNLPFVFWGGQDDLNRWKHDLDLWVDEMEVPKNPWAQFGVGTLRGIAVLSELERKGYYLKTCQPASLTDVDNNSDVGKM